MLSNSRSFAMRWARIRSKNGETGVQSYTSENLPVHSIFMKNVNNETLNQQSLCDSDKIR